MRYKYPRLTLLAISFILAYLIFIAGDFEWLRKWLESLGIFGVFLAGILYAYGFTAPIGAAALIVLAKQHNFIIASLIAGIGTVLGDLVIFQLIREEFMKEIHELGREHIVVHLRWVAEQSVHAKIREYLLPALGVFVIAAPLPDELGAAMLAASKNISETLFLIICFALNTLGIMTLLYIGQMI